jgi:hypothetical protein
VDVAAVVDAELSAVTADEEATEEEIAVDVAVLVAEAIIGVVEATGAAVVLDVEPVLDASGVVLEALVEVSGRGEVVEAVSSAAAR